MYPSFVMTNEEILREMSTLPIEARRQIERYIDYWKRRNNTDSKTPAKKPLREEEFVGMWADREDMKDSVAWVRKIRQTQWSKLR